MTAAIMFDGRPATEEELTRPLPTPSELWDAYCDTQNGNHPAEEVAIRIRVFVQAWPSADGKRPPVPTFEDIGALYVFASDVRGLGEELIKQARSITDALIQLDAIRSDHDPMHTNRSEVAA